MIPQKLTGSDEKRKCREQLKEILRRYKNDLPLMDPIEDMHITGKPTQIQTHKGGLLLFSDSKLNEIVKKIEAYEKRLSAHPLHGKPETEKIMLQGNYTVLY